MFKLGDFVTIIGNGSGRVIGIDEGPELLFAVEHDGDDSVTWHTANELQAED
jgi:hypothetical protein